MGYLREWIAGFTLQSNAPVHNEAIPRLDVVIRQV